MHWAVCLQRQQWKVLQLKWKTKVKWNEFSSRWGGWKKLNPILKSGVGGSWPKGENGEGKGSGSGKRGKGTWRMRRTSIWVGIVSCYIQPSVIQLQPEIDWYQGLRIRSDRLWRIASGPLALPIVFDVFFHILRSSFGMLMTMNHWCNVLCLSAGISLIFLSGVSFFAAILH